MPEISNFYGIIIYMFPQEHNPPHFHVKYNEFKASDRHKDRDDYRNTSKTGT